MSDHDSTGTNLPREEAPLRVRHDGKVPAVLGAQAGDAVGGAVGVERVGLGRVVGVVDEPIMSFRDYLFIQVKVQNTTLLLSTDGATEPDGIDNRSR